MQVNPPFGSNAMRRESLLNHDSTGGGCLQFIRLILPSSTVQICLTRAFCCIERTSRESVKNQANKYGGLINVWLQQKIISIFIWF